MEQAIITLVSFSIALTIYLDRARRGDMRDGFARVDKQFDKVDKQFEKVDERFERLETRLEKKIEDSASRTDTRINELNRSVIELAQNVGRAEGRTEVLTAVE